MLFDKIFLILGWAGVGMVIVDLHVYSPFPGKLLTHIGAVTVGVCFVIGCARIVFFKKSQKPGKKD